MTGKLKFAWLVVAVMLSTVTVGGLAAQARPETPKKGAPKKEATPSRPTVLMCTTMLHLDPGRAGPKPARPPMRIRLRYRAVPLSPETLEAIRANPRARAFYNGRVLRRLVRFGNDVPVRIGEATLRPSTYDAGFVCLAKGRWLFVVLDRDGQAAATGPLAISGGEAEIPCLSMSLVPGGKPGRFTLAARYGTMRGTLAMEIVKPAEEKGKGKS